MARIIVAVAIFAAIIALTTAAEVEEKKSDLATASSVGFGYAGLYGPGLYGHGLGYAKAYGAYGILPYGLGYGGYGLGYGLGYKGLGFGGYGGHLYG